MGKACMGILCTILQLFCKSQITSKLKGILICFLKTMVAESWYTLIVKIECSNSGSRFWFKFPLCSFVAVRTWVSDSSPSASISLSIMQIRYNYMPQGVAVELRSVSKGLSSMPGFQQMLKKWQVLVFSQFHLHIHKNPNIQWAHLLCLPLV